MAEDSKPKVWSVATESEIDTVFRESDIAVTTQDAELVYTAAVNPFVNLPQGKGLVGLTDEAVFNGAARNLTITKRRVADTGEGESLDLSYSFNGHDRWYRIRLEPLAGEGPPRGVLAASIDITRQKTAEEHLRLALLELAHRSKNLLAVVLSLARQSADDSRDLEDFRGHFVGRIRALALAHDILTEEAWRGATVFSLVRSQLRAFSDHAPDQLLIEGHNAFLKPNAVQYVGLALHELIAHSILHGALARSDGRVEVTTSVEEDEEEPASVLRIGWRESCAMSAVKEGTTAFGRVLLEQIVPAALSGTAQLNQPDSGELVYELRIPSSQFF
jgi:two-component sensor histidine kinase